MDSFLWRQLYVSGAMPDFTPSTLLWGLLFGSIGTGFFVYGRKQQEPVPMVCGVGLMVFPYFVSNSYLLVVIGIVLVAIPWFARG
jgi:hypothetical protein